MKNILKENDIIDSINEEFKERIKSPFYGTFAIAWIISNWKAIYITFFVNQDLIYKTSEKLKLEYILDLYYIETVPKIIPPLLKVIILPAIYTYFIIWILSKLDYLVFEKNDKNQLKKIIFQKKQRAENLKQEVVVERRKKEVLIAEEEKIKAQKRIEKTSKEKWDTEYKKLMKYNNFGKVMTLFRSCLYEHKGNVSVEADWGGGLSFSLPPKYISFLDLEGIAEFKGSNNSLQATTKGKYLLKKYIEEKNNKNKNSLK